MAQKSKLMYEENDGIHLTKIIDAVPCSRHAVDIGSACWNLGSKSGILRAICDNRARSAGANGQISGENRPPNAPPRRHTTKEYTR